MVVGGTSSVSFQNGLIYLMSAFCRFNMPARTWKARERKGTNHPILDSILDLEILEELRKEIERQRHFWCCQRKNVELRELRGETTAKSDEKLMWTRY